MLNISGTMIANYVEKGKIRHIIPPERKHGFYLKKDVDKLANEPNMVFNLEKETENVRFTVATVDDLPACIALNKDLFRVLDSADDATLYKNWAGWLEKNPEIVYVLKREQEVIGIVTMLPVKPNSQKLDEILRGDTSILLGNVNIAPQDIEKYKSGKHIELYIAEIGIKPSLHKDLRRKYGAKLISKLVDTIIEFGKRGVIIEKILALGATRSGTRLLQHFGFTEVVFSRPDTRLFTMDLNESVAPFTNDYRESLKGTLHEADR